MRQPLRFYKLLLAALMGLGAPPAFARDDLITLSTMPQPPVGFTHLPYVNPNAPKGGSITLSSVGDFDNLNPFILRGSAPASIYLVWQTLFKQSDTDSVTVYADLARSVDISADGLTVTFHLDPRARFSDGTEVLASDVVWTFHSLITQGTPFYASFYAGVANVVAPDAETVVFHLKPGSGRDMPENLAGLYVLPEHFWKGKDFSQPLLTPPVGSGAYQVSQLSFGNSITYTHVKNWWAANLPANVGYYNFDTYQDVFFQNDSVALQAFKAGQIDARVESSAKQWASSYKFAAVAQGQVTMERLPVSLPAGIDGWAMNTRRAIFADARVRQALTLAFDFEWMNRVLFYGSYERYNSYYSHSFLASSGLPSADELALLAPFKGEIPDAIFTTPYALPVTDGGGYNLPQLRQAMALLEQAGWRVVNGSLVNAQGEPFRFEILLDNQLFERLAVSYAADLKLLGIDATVRTIDPATYERRTQNFDFDMTYAQFPESDYPGSEQDDYWSCAAAHHPGSNNLMGVCSTAIDALIKAQNDAMTTAQKIAAIHALDRLLLNGWYLVPAWTSKTMRVAYWNRLARQSAPLQIGVDFNLWWAR